MKLMDLRTNERFTVEDLQCRLLIDKKWLGDTGKIMLIDRNHFKFIMGQAAYDFSVLEVQDAVLLADKLKHYPYNLAQVSAIGNNTNVFFLHVVFFYSARREPNLNIVLGQRVINTLKKKNLLQDNMTLEGAVRDNFILDDGIETYYAYASGKYKFLNKKNTTYDDEFDNTETLYEDEEIGDFKTLKLFGRDYSLTVRIKGRDEKMYLLADGIDTRNIVAPPMALMIGDLSFKDEKSFVSESVKNELKVKSGYLAIWDNYTNIEGEFLLNKARVIGKIEINRKKYNRAEDGLIIYPLGLNDAQRKLIAPGDYLLVTEKEPVYLEDKNMNWRDYRKYLAVLKANNIQQPENKHYKIKHIDKSGYWIIDTIEDALVEGVVSYSILGDSEQIKRRETARELIINGEAAFPMLGLVIEGKHSEEAINARRKRKIEPITAFVKEKIFAYEPRSKQRDAIEIALNTPDIAIIQGPPGTGKTTVITAIIERLNEIADKRKINNGSVLVTSFQHDAVRNVIQRLTINSLPTIKFGKQGEEDVSQEKSIERWCEKYTKRLKERNPAIQKTSEQKELELKHNIYLVSPNRTNALSFLNFAKKINTDNAINDLIEQIIDEINTVDDTSTLKIVNKIRRLRTTKEGFLDDGPETADDLLYELESFTKDEVDNNKLLKVLSDAASSSSNNVELPTLNELEALKKDLLERCLPRPSYKLDTPSEDINDVYIRISRNFKQAGNAEEEILFNLLNEFESNLSDVEKTISNYNFVYAATAQQSEGKEIRNAKNVGWGQHPTYDTVIIDEAARVNPGDLMIPMTQAERRIILVGDHRQLPHIYDEEIFENMRDSGNEIGKDIVKVSMFEYLKAKAEDLFRQDGIPRTITLDAQYRMHPELGDFVNNNFYSPHGEGFISPLPADKFTQALSSRPYMWIDVPNRKGAEEREGTSRLRRCEAEIIANVLNEYITSDGGKDLSYGVITFYSAQARLIQRLLRANGITEEQCRVGSVDAFQGMEFDVIFLSVVRTHARAPIINYELLNGDKRVLDEKEAQGIDDYKAFIGMKNYGFLTSENRLCVALSRQKKLLIVVGDSNIFCSEQWTDIAEKCVPAMKNFYELCKENGAVING